MDKANQAHFVSLSSFYSLLKRCKERATVHLQKGKQPSNDDIANEMMKDASSAFKNHGVEMIKRLKGALDFVSIDNIELLDIDAINRFLLIPSSQRNYQTAKDIFNTQTFLGRKSHWILNTAVQRGQKKPHIKTFEEQAEVGIFSVFLCIQCVSMSGTCFVSFALQVYKFLFDRRDRDVKQAIGNETTTEKAVMTFCALRDFKDWITKDPMVGRKSNF